MSILTINWVRNTLVFPQCTHELRLSLSQSEGFRALFLNMTLSSFSTAWPGSPPLSASSSETNKKRLKDWVHELEEKKHPSNILIMRQWRRFGQDGRQWSRNLWNLWSSATEMKEKWHRHHVLISVFKMFGNQEAFRSSAQSPNIIGGKWKCSR